MPKLTIDGIPCEVSEGTTILEAARRAGVRVPTLCFLRKTSAIASCRMCVVDIEGAESPVPACATQVRDGMEVATASPRLLAYRRVALELLLADCPPCAAHACAACDADGDCALQALCEEHGVFAAAGSEPPAKADTPPMLEVLDTHPFLTYDPARCIRCQRCVGACNVRAGNRTLKTGKRGVRTLIEAPFGEGWNATRCESCGNCAQACPTGALAEKRRRGYKVCDVRQVRTTCPHCGVGCQLDLAVRDGRIVDATGAPGPSNKRLLCVKGRSASFDFVDSPDRLTTPLVRDSATGQLEPSTWDYALDLVARRFTELRDVHGGASLAAFACSRATNEDIYLFQKMARTALRTNNVDCCARV